MLEYTCVYNCVCIGLYSPFPFVYLTYPFISQFFGGGYKYSTGAGVAGPAQQETLVGVLDVREKARKASIGGSGGIFSRARTTD